MSNYQSAEEIEAAISKRLAEINTLQKKLEAAKNNSPEHLARQLHSMTCFCRLISWNHTDGCAWFYEVDKNGVDNWSRPEHEIYLKKAVRLMHSCKEQGIEVKQAIELYKIIKE
jgi:hypothetical protein